MVVQRSKVVPNHVPQTAASASDITSELLAALLAATPDQKAGALKLLRGELTERQPSPEPYLTLRDLAAQIHFHPSTLWRWGIPKHELAGRPRFLASEVIAYLSSEPFKRRADDIRLKRRASR